MQPEGNARKALAARKMYSGRLQVAFPCREYAGCFTYDFAMYCTIVSAARKRQLCLAVLQGHSPKHYNMQGRGTVQY